MLLALLTAAATLAFVQVQRSSARRPALYAVKPLPILLLAGGLFLCGEPRDAAARAWTAAGLAASLAGDLCLIAEKGFLPGLASFLLAHVLYVVAFAAGAPAAHWGEAAPIAAVYLLAGVVLCAVLFPRLGRLRLPVAVYAFTLCAMCTAAWARGLAADSLAAPAGATLFLLSDAILAVDRFHTPFRAAKPLLFVLYIAGQALIAGSAWKPIPA
jgi:uncharacterized membrane protein YhhN